MANERFDTHQHITAKIVSAIERGAGDFRLPWHRSKGSSMRPVNIASKKAYRGVNVHRRLTREVTLKVTLAREGVFSRLYLQTIALLLKMRRE